MYIGIYMLHMLLHIGNKEQLYIICTFAAIFLDEEQYNIEYKNCYIKKKNTTKKIGKEKVCLMVCTRLVTEETWC